LLSFTLYGKYYEFTDSEKNPGIYVISIPASELAELPEDSEFQILCHFEKLNYTTQEFKIYIQVGLRVDPVFHVPYRYWMIAAITIGSFLALSFARSAYMKATIPMTIQNISKISKIIKKGKIAPDKKFEPTAPEQAYLLFNASWSILELDMKDALGITEIKADSKQSGELSTKEESKKNMLESDIDALISRIDATESTNKANVPAVKRNKNYEDELDDIFNLTFEDKDEKEKKNE